MYIYDRSNPHKKKKNRKDEEEKKKGIRNTKGCFKKNMYVCKGEDALI